MASLPNKSFVFNYNARDYNPATFTIPKTSGQTMDRDMVWTATTTAVRNQIAFDEDHISVPLSAYSVFNFTTSGANPMNNTAAAPAMTIIMKRKLNSYNGGANDIANRGPSDGTPGDFYNWMLRSDNNRIVLHTLNYNAGAGQYVSFSPGSVVTYALRVNNNRQIEIKNLTDGTSNTPFTSSWVSTGTRLFSFFVWYYNGAVNECMSGDFYWCYASREVLTDEEIQQVIAFNENTFGPDITGGTIAASGGTLTTNLESETGWTATTTSPWITISPVSGESGTTVSFTVQKALSQRTGVVTFTSDGGDTAEYTITQEGMEGIVPINKVYKGTRRLN